MIKVSITHSLFNQTVAQIPYSAIEMTRNMSNLVEVSIIVKFKITLSFFLNFFELCTLCMSLRFKDQRSRNHNKPYPNNKLLSVRR